MKNNSLQYIAIGIICTFFLLVLGISFIFNLDYPLTVISGEDSVGTWMSGVLLIMSASFAIILGIKNGWFPWSIIVSFFFLLALDEKFMFHEQLKEKIIFNSTLISPEWHLKNESPVLFGIFLGIFITIILWRYLSYFGKYLIFFSAILGITSAVFDILSAGVFIEDSCKLLGELCITCALLQEIILIDNYLLRDKSQIVIEQSFSFTEPKQMKL